MRIRTARIGYAVVAIDYMGHGRSDGLHGLISNVDDIARDVSFTASFNDVY